MASAFEKRKWNTEVVDFGVPYDFASIMHYPFTAFSKNGKPTIRNIVDMQGKTPYIVLSDGDARQTNAMYKCNGKEILHLLWVNTVFISCNENRKQRKSVTFQIICRKLPHVTESGFLNLGNFCLRNQENSSRNSESHKRMESRIQVPLTRSGIQYVESRIQDCCGFPYMAKIGTFHRRPPPPPPPPTPASRQNTKAAWMWYMG